ncbi:hypothetical protein FGG08_005458 [Glutinoglossum americanum]|uniref:Uncharacterized protein n=1 Tax=Glutinoglossum americanum TaxID=1670608 RepID=A0A9P8L1U2_9PEZI|nr:hypothetical protein FGG08_005458 [Glutinoglossum americanum]
MEENDHRRRANDLEGNAGSPQIGNTGRALGRPLGGASDRLRQVPLLASRSPTSASTSSRGGRATGYGYIMEDPQYATPALPGGTLQYQSEYPQDPQRQHPFHQYGSNPMYNVPQQVSQNPSYDPVQQYPPRQSAAIEVLSSQFAGVQQYYEPTSAPGPVGPSQHAHSQFSSIQYPQQASLGRSPLPQPYASGLGGLSQVSAPEPMEEQEFGQGSSAFDQAYDQYQTALKQTFLDARSGHLIEAGNSLEKVSDWLLSHAVELGLVRDEPELHSDRMKLWNEFNTCWLAVLQKEKDMILEFNEAGQSPQPPQGIIPEESLERMGRELIRLCDSMERHGLVDYQMGVWEEEIIGILQECLELLENNNEGTTTGSRTGPAATSHNPGSSTGS